MKRSSTPAALPLLEGERGVCCGGDPAEAEAGVRMFELGGNAIDAVVAAAFMAFVVEQIDCGLGGFAHVSMRTHRGHLSVEGYVRAPAAAKSDMFEVDPAATATYYGHPPTRGDAARYGALSVAVPGAVAGLCRAHAEGGRLELAAVVEPAIERARAGIPFTWRDALAIGRLHEQIRAREPAAGVLLLDGRPPQIPSQSLAPRRDGTALARTLEAIANRGAAGFYTGPVAETLASSLQREGGRLGMNDLEAFRPGVARETPVRYRGWECTTCFDHVAYEALQILDGLDLPVLDPDGVEARHLMAEALGVAFTDGIEFYDGTRRGSSLVSGLRSPEFAAFRREQLRRDRALSRPITPVDPSPYCPSPAHVDLPAGRWGWPGTTQLVAADIEGNMASVITAVGWDYGSLVFVEELGIFLNNAMSYFDPRPGRRASIAPGKTPMFGAPALVATGPDGQGIALAGSGGYRIQTAVLHALSGRVDFGLPLDQAIERPRVHCQGRQTVVDARIPAEIRRQLTERGHEVLVVEENPATWHFGRVCGVEVSSGSVRGSAGPVWDTAARAL